MKYTIKLIIAMLIVVITGYRLPVSGYAEQLKYIRVAILQDTNSLGLSVKGFYRIIDGSNQKVLSKGKYLRTTVTVSQSGILIAGINYETSKVFIEADDPDAIIINGRKYRGNIQFIKKDNSCLLVVNYIELEDYIKGILYHEVSHYWPQEALKAQAVICRTYAVYQAQQNSAKDYDLTNDIYSQIYGGRTSERYRTNIAVNETKGLILSYHNQIFPAYFHATCAGHTEDASLLWNIDIEPLKGVVCNFCKESPHFSWHQVLPLKQIENTLLEAGYKQCGNIRAIVVLDKDTSGRIRDLKIETTKKDIKISAKEFRNILGPNIIRSTNFNVNIAGNDAVFEGFGWGHGVGMCQWGAYFMAKQGYNYNEILKYYYPGADVSLIVDR